MNLISEVAPLHQGGSYDRKHNGDKTYSYEGNCPFESRIYGATANIVPPGPHRQFSETLGYMVISGSGNYGQHGDGADVMQLLEVGAPRQAADTSFSKPMWARVSMRAGVEKPKDPYYTNATRVFVEVRRSK